MGGDDNHDRIGRQTDQYDIDRRTFVQVAGAAGAGGLMSFSGCLGGFAGGNGGSGGGGGEGISATEPAKSVTFIAESTPPSKALQQLAKDFTSKTGITVKFTLIPFNNYAEKVATDLTSQSGTYDVLYVDPYVVGAKFYPQIQSLDPLMNSKKFEDIPQGVGDFIQSQVDAAGRYGDGKLRALPYDCTTMMWVYRDDIIQKYKKQATKELGFEFQPSPKRTWEEYYQMAKWMNENVTEVNYGTGHQAKQHDSLQCDFHNVFWAYGGEDFEGYNGQPGDKLGKNPKPNFTGKQGIEAAKFYNRLIKIAHPGSTTWTWSGVGQAFAGGKIAMTPEWHEFNSMFADPKQSDVAQSVGWSLLPKGNKRNANIYGGSGIGINANTSDAKKLAAWKFILWATSPKTQVQVLKQAGGTPTRTSVYERPAIKKASKKPTEKSKYPNVVPPVQDAWKDSNIGLRPHIAAWPELDQQLYTELSKMVSGGKSPKAAMKAVDRQWANTLK
jgi:multiple sugar transport system substrate-binding protein